ncbi:MAG: O-antigen ligase family protein [Patescibacteria group bacterium]|nr:O-antigen ligase family protein [Patescibacteria group bacterium]MCL5432202.1 O-antigen ligase family protein [Patescibacteria group bacterium]
MEYLYYLLFFLVPLIFTAANSELFEFNKMVLVYSLTVIIAAAWLVKMIRLKKFVYRHTPLEIPLLAYLLAHLLSTIFSIDPHVSVWGYYSRFHEGLLASISYALLYFAAVSNLRREHVIKMLTAAFVSAAVVSFWAILEHFGHSFSCLFITGDFNDACWVQDVAGRVFATLGQPNWLAAYLDVIILTAVGFLRSKKTNLPTYLLLVISLAALWFTKSRSGLLGLGAGAAVFFLLVWKSDIKLKALVCAAVLLVGSFWGWQQFQKLVAAPTAGGSGGVTDSETIRLPVWEGAIKVWQRYPVFGSGVETFGYSFYKDRPASKNLDSEWDFLYNKAHNEYLNMLATTGTVGILAYLALIGAVLWFLRKNPALLAAYISILVTNFFGFSVVIIGLFFFLIPAFYFILNFPDIEPEKTEPPNWWLIGAVIAVALYLEWGLVNLWLADKDYALGQRFDQAQQFPSAYQPIKDAVATNPDEPTYRDELSFNESVLAVALTAEGNSQASASAQQLTQAAIADSNQVVAGSPNAVPFWKTRVKVFYELAQIDPQYYYQALAAIEKAADLAPTDAKIHYNLGLLLGRTGQTSAAIQAFAETVALKPDYRDAHYALGLYLKEAGDIKSARAQMEFIINKIGPDQDAQQFLQENK